VALAANVSDTLDELYREHPDEFVAGRNRLVKDLRAAGEREQAEEVRRLRRPSAAAWLLNRVALSSPDRLEQFAAAVEELEAAQGAVLDGKDDAAAAWRAAVARQREAAAAVVEDAARMAHEAGRDPGQRALELVGETLTAASGDPELRARVLEGRVERERAGATLPMPAAPAPRRRTRAPAARKDTAGARRELKRLERELASAEDRERRSRERIAKAEDALRGEKEKLAEHGRATATLRRELKAAQRKARA
jgi:hypothetical protein